MARTPKPPAKRLKIKPITLLKQELQVLDWIEQREYDLIKEQWNMVEVSGIVRPDGQTVISHALKTKDKALLEFLFRPTLQVGTQGAIDEKAEDFWSHISPSLLKDKDMVHLLRQGGFPLWKLLKHAVSLDDLDMFELIREPDDWLTFEQSDALLVEAINQQTGTFKVLDYLVGMHDWEKSEMVSANWMEAIAGY